VGPGSFCPVLRQRDAELVAAVVPGEIRSAEIVFGGSAILLSGATAAGAELVAAVVPGEFCGVRSAPLK
jgi:hypothetical protein